MKDRIIVDIDGTLTDATHRQHLVTGPGKKLFDAFYDLCGDDAPHQDVIAMVNSLSWEYSIHLVTGRVERVRPQTMQWLAKWGVHWGSLHMRPDGDFTPDHELKVPMAHRAGLYPHNVVAVLDDRDRVVTAWREAGYRVLQVAPGAF